MSDKNRKELSEAELAAAAGGTGDQVQDTRGDASDTTPGSLIDPPADASDTPKGGDTRRHDT